MVVGQYMNTGTVQVAGGPSDTDDSHYLGVQAPNPNIDIEKATNGVDADSPQGPTLNVGSQVTWTYVVTSTGNTDFDLADINVTDSDAAVTPVRDAGTDVGSDNVLSAGESWTYSATGTVVLGQYSNTGTVQVFLLSDTDDSHYLGVEAPNPDIDIEKATNGQDADSATGPQLTEGDAVNWTYVVTNTGNIDFTLGEITVTDSEAGVNPVRDAGTDAGGDNVLSAGESWTYTAAGVAVVGQYMNTGTVQVAGGPSDTDDSHYLGTAILEPGIDIEKHTNGQDADTPTGPSISVGDQVNWEYLVTNTGSIDFLQANISVIDSDAGVDPVLDAASDIGSDGVLSVGETWRYTATGAATEGQYMNTGTVQVANGPSDSDDSHYTGVDVGDLEIIDFKVNDGGDQRSNIEMLMVTFNCDANIAELIQSGQINNAVQLVNTSSNLVIGLSPSRFIYDPATATLMIDVSGIDNHLSILADGTYELRFDSALLAAADDPDKTLAQDEAFGFFQKFGDFDGDDDVDSMDRCFMFNEFGNTDLGTKSLRAFDVNADGKVDLLDYRVWRDQNRIPGNDGNDD